LEVAGERRPATDVLGGGGDAVAGQWRWRRWWLRRCGGRWGGADVCDRRQRRRGRRARRRDRRRQRGGRPRRRVRRLGRERRSRGQWWDRGRRDDVRRDNVR